MALVSPPNVRSLEVSLGEVQALESPAGTHSGEPCLAVAPNGGVWMSWLERRTRGAALMVAPLVDGKWSKPRALAESDSFFVNWADAPGLAALGGERLALAWPWKRGGGGGYAYDLRAAISPDGGASWSRPVTVNRDGTPTEHGFVSLVPSGDGAELVWLDGRKFAAKKPSAKGHEPEGDMAVRTARLDTRGGLIREVEIDPRACDCCNTAATAVPGGMLVAYRDRDKKETRDIAVARLEAGRWNVPTTLHVDGWKIAGCPVNGPALDAIGPRVVAAWFTMVASQPRVQVAFSSNGGRSFGAPIAVSASDPLGRVDVALLPDGSALVSWLEALGQDALLRVQRVSVAGTQAQPVTVARTSAARASGFPRMVVSGDRAYFAWVETKDANRLRTASARIP
jgi:hypothetical protein